MNTYHIHVNERTQTCIFKTLNKPLLCLRSPDFYEEVSNNNSDAVYNNFEQMLLMAGSYGGGLQSDTLQDLEGTFALAQDMKSVSRPELHNSFLNFANIATDRQHHRSCEPPMLTRPGRLQDVIETQMSGKLSVSAPTYTQWSFPSTLQKQQQQILIPKLEEYALTSYMPRPQGPML